MHDDDDPRLERRPVRRAADVRTAKGVLRAVQALRKRHPEAAVIRGHYVADEPFIRVAAEDAAGRIVDEMWIAR